MVQRHPELPKQPAPPADLLRNLLTRPQQQRLLLSQAPLPVAQHPAPAMALTRWLYPMFSVLLPSLLLSFHSSSDHRIPLHTTVVDLFMNVVVSLSWDMFVPYI